ncbi:adenylate/guanylate cyclase domain-containing protein [Lichenihabitans sp. Uapishka_5]|uniref:adenylate/guanylate cyclase domain-containing protein n=1 Tax=Lichenihabitans sp. Uapishka_5 TaxID=3037302 RepID=UPI0029E7CD9F|nr:adenylate/guanylate cyclase domain-containing protein [Lichenihabitans sp. Uapishka_5]MDX7951944.1 adenylate/guanylate cyclase domain-containing protein [Lichenihabitans sp. Uapishka_5]
MSNAPTPGGPDDQRLARAIAAFVRAEFKAPVDIVSSFIDLVTEDAVRDRLSGFEADLLKMKSSSETLGSVIEGLLDTSAAQRSLSERELGDFTATLRHELRTPITAIMGYGELLLEEAREEGLPGLVETLDGLLAASRRLLGGIDSMIEFIHSGSLTTTHGDDAEGSDAVEKAVATLSSIFAERPTPVGRATGYLLVVDDNPSSLDLLTRRLERDGHRVCGCGDGEAALRLSANESFDLILLDFLMPNLNGVDVLRQLRAVPETASVPVVMMSGSDEVESAVRCIEAGADDLMQKPLDPILLRSRISSLIERKALRDREQAYVAELRIERERSEQLLRAMLPGPVVERLRGGETVIADHFDAATILFCDIVGFTTLASRLPAARTIALLNTVFSSLDGLAKANGLEKIKTIGDAYLVAGGLPNARPDHALAVARMAVAIPEAVAAAGRSAGEHLEARIGMHTGPVAAGVIGTDKFVYDVWGDTVNVASRMETNGVPGRVHVSEAVRTALGDAFAYEPLPPMMIKGKGAMQTFLLS